VGHGSPDTLFVDVHTTVLTAHALLYEPPQEVVADFTPHGRLVVVHLGKYVGGGGSVERGRVEERRKEGRRNMFSSDIAQ